MEAQGKCKLTSFLLPIVNVGELLSIMWACPISLPVLQLEFRNNYESSDLLGSQAAQW